MKQKILLLSTLVFVPFVTTSSFLDVYSTWTERLLGNPTANFQHMQGFSSYGQKSTVDLTLTTPDLQGNATLTADMRTDKTSNIAGTVHLVASGSSDMLSGSIDVGADLVFSSGTLYVKPTLTKLPSEITAEQQVGFQLLDGKWLQANDPAKIPAITLPAFDSVLLSQQLTALVTTTPVLKSTKEISRNGYEIYLVDIDPVGIESLVAGVVNTMTTQIGLPAETAMSLPAPADLGTLGIKTIGVIGKKGDEIKMGMLVKKSNDPHHVIFSSFSTSTGTQLNVRMVEKRTKNSVFTFSLSNDFSTLGTQDMKINFGATDDKIDLSAHITTNTYDGGTDAITAPTGAILLSDLTK